MSVKMAKWEQLASSAWEGRSGRLAETAQCGTLGRQDDLWAVSMHSLRLRHMD